MLNRLLRTWLLTAAIDALFSSVLVIVFYHGTFARLWQGVASVPLGAAALNGGTRTVAIGLTLHLCVAFTWSAVFLLLYNASAAIRRVAAEPFGVPMIASVYGPMIWLVMSLVVIPAFTHHAPTFTYRWWVQLLGHIPFVAMPIIWGIREGGRRQEV